MQADPAAQVGSTGESPGGTDDGAATTSFVTSCGKVLDIVPVAAVARGAAVEIRMEVHPVCPAGEWIASSDFAVTMTDAAGSVLAAGRFDLAGSRVLIPGFGDPASYFVARFDRGTAWADPATVSGAISDGTVLVACEAADGAKGTPTRPGEVTDDVSVTASSTSPDPTDGTTSEDAEANALEALQRQVLEDDPAVSELEGAWVPQLSSKKKGTYDDFEGRTYSLSDIYQQFLAHRLKYPNVRLLNSSQWQSYTLPGYWVTIAGVPFNRPNQPNSWCNARSIPPSQCFAKKLVRDGSPEGTTKHRG